jgi:hypothetical protein
VGEEERSQSRQPAALPSATPGIAAAGERGKTERGKRGAVLSSPWVGMKRDRRRRAQRREAGLGEKRRGTFMETRRRGGKRAPVGRGTGGVGEARGRRQGGIRDARSG